MDRNNITGLILIALLIIGWTLFFAPEPSPEQAVKGPALTDTSLGAQASPADVATSLDAADSTTVRVTVQDPQLDSMAAAATDSAQRAARFGAFTPVATGEAQTITVRTDQLTATLSTAGGQLQAVTLNDHQDFAGNNLPVLPAGQASYQNLRFGHGTLVIDTRSLYYEASTEETVTLSGAQTQAVRLRATLAPGRYLEHVYTFTGEGYEIGYQLTTVGLDGLIRGNYLDFETSVGVPWTEQNHTEQLNRTQVFYRVDDDVESLSPATDEPETEKGILSARWISFKSMFFLAALIPQEQFSDVSVRAEPTLPEDASPTRAGQVMQRLSSQMRLQLQNANADSVAMTWYFGPTDRQLLAAYKLGLADQLKLGWGPIGWINKGIIVPLFGLLEGFTTNYGIIILILAVFIKLVLSPLTYRSYVSNAKMQVVNNMEEVKALDEKYKDDPTKLQQMKMAFYAKVGVSPLAGCLPLLLQMPVFFAMFTFFPQSIELRQEAFLWAHDLSTYDTAIKLGFHFPGLGSHISGFALLMTISQLGYTYVTQQSQTFSGPMASMKYMGYFFPFIFFFVLNSYSSGLSWYYLVINVLTIVQTYAIKATINQDKLHDKILASKEKRAKSGKASGGGLAGWLEKQQKKQAEMIRERNDQRFKDTQKKSKPRKR